MTTWMVQIEPGHRQPGVERLRKLPSKHMDKATNKPVLVITYITNVRN